MEAVKRKKRIKDSTLLILLCWLVYMSSYIGKVNYSANITRVEAFYNVTHANAGMVSTFFFFAYGAGQIFNGIFCKKYNKKYVVFGGMLVSGLCNLAIGFLNSFAPIKFLWMLNGIALSVLWPSMIGLLGDTLKREDMGRASVVMGTTVAVGTLIIYGLSSIYALIGSFKLAFYTAGIVAPTVGVVWLLFVDKLTRRVRSEGEEDNVEVAAVPQPEKGKKMPGDLVVMIAIMASFAIVTNLVADGLTTWVPSILKETYGVTDSLSILLTLALPMVAVFANFFAVSLHKKIPNYILQCGFIFLCAGILIGIVLGVLSSGLMIVTLVLFAIVRFLAGSSNSTITSIFPLFMKGKVNSGMMAGLLNGFCYVGSTISSYGLGMVADNFGWTAVFYVLLGACAFVVAVALVYGIAIKVKKKKA